MADEQQALRKAESVNELVRLNITAWLSVKEARDKIVQIKDGNKIEIVNAQLQFYKNVMLAGRKSVPYFFFTKSKNSVKHTYDELFEKLCNVITFTISPCEGNGEVTKTTLKPLEVRDELYSEHKKNLHNKIKETRQKNAISKQNIESIPRLLKNPDIFIGCTIRHLVKEDKVGPEIWTTGIVCGIDKYSITDVRYTRFDVEYDEDLGSLYAFPLLLDMEKGDCFILKEPPLNP